MNPESLNVLKRVVKSKEHTPNTIQLIQHLFWSKGFTQRQFNEEFDIPTILELVSTEAYLKKQQQKANKKGK